MPPWRHADQPAALAAAQFEEDNLADDSAETRERYRARDWFAELMAALSRQPQAQDEVAAAATWTFLDFYPSTTFVNLPECLRLVSTFSKFNPAAENSHFCNDSNNVTCDVKAGGIPAIAFAHKFSSFIETTSGIWLNGVAVQRLQACDISAGALGRAVSHQQVNGGDVAFPLVEL